ncbi:MAG: S8 family serine peptidase [Verrucomicrobiales bacterium]
MTLGNVGKIGWPGLEDVRRAAETGNGAGVRVAVVDSGIQPDHPRLATLALRDSIAFSEQQGRMEVLEDAGHDAYGHGTAVADLIHRIAPEAEIGSFRVIDARSVSRTHLICAGVKEAMNRGYQILNCSFGCRGLAKFILPHKEWADEAWRRGIHVVAACSNTDSNETEWPSHFSSVIGVDLADTDSDDFFYRPDHMVGFSARGEQMEVAWLGGGVQYQTGTSYAAPRLTGTIARILSVYPDIHPSLMHTILSSLSEPWHPGLSSDL